MLSREGPEAGLQVKERVPVDVPEPTVKGRVLLPATATLITPTVVRNVEGMVTENEVEPAPDGTISEFEPIEIICPEEKPEPKKVSVEAVFNGTLVGEIELNETAPPLLLPLTVTSKVPEVPLAESVT